MIHQFHFRVCAAPYRRHTASCPSVAGAADPLVELLQNLITHQVTVLADGTEYTGLLITADPVTLTGPQGQVSVLAPERVQSVAF